MTTEKVGRVRVCRLGPRRLDDETTWIAAYRQMLEAQLDRLGDFLEQAERIEVMSTPLRRPEPEVPGVTDVTTPGPREIRIERVFDAPRELVWRAFTEPGAASRSGGVAATSSTSSAWRSSAAATGASSSTAPRATPASRGGSAR